MTKCSEILQYGLGITLWETLLLSNRGIDIIYVFPEYDDSFNTYACILSSQHLNRFNYNNGLAIIDSRDKSKTYYSKLDPRIKKVYCSTLAINCLLKSFELTELSVKTIVVSLRKPLCRGNCLIEGVWGLNKYDLLKEGIFRV